MNVTRPLYTVAMAKNKWNIVKTSGGYGVLKSQAGTRITKSTVVRPTVTDSQRASTLRTKNAH